MLLYVGMMACVALTAPEKVTIINFILERVDSNGPAMSGFVTEIGSGQKARFEFDMSESIRTVSFLVMGVAVLGILAGITKVLISTGLSMIKLSREPGQEFSKHDYHV